jgi:hypothetical protein
VDLLFGCSTFLMVMKNEIRRYIMLHGEFTRGTTPTHIFCLPEPLFINDISDVSIAYRQKRKTVLIKHLEDCHFLPELDSTK